MIKKEEAACHYGKLPICTGKTETEGNERTTVHPEGN